MFTDPLPVKRCVCFDTSFASLKAAGIISVEDAKQKFGCGTKCGTCVPYIEKMLESGEVQFTVLDFPTPAS